MLSFFANGFSYLSVCCFLVGQRERALNGKSVFIVRSAEQIVGRNGKIGCDRKQILGRGKSVVFSPFVKIRAREGHALRDRAVRCLPFFAQFFQPRGKRRGAAEGINSFFSVLPKRYEKESSSASAILISARVVGTIPNSAARAITGRLTPVRSANALLEKQSLSSMIARMRFRNAAETLYSVFAGTLGMFRLIAPCQFL